MNRAVLPIAVAAAIAVAIAAAWWVLARPAGGDTGAVRDSRALAPFRQLVLEGNAVVTLVQGDAESIAFDVPGRTVLHAEVDGGVLTLRAEDARRWWSSLLGTKRGTPQVTVTFRNLDSVRASGAVKLLADRVRADALAMRFSGAATVTIGTLDARAFAIHGSGAFKGSVAGHVEEQQISISGAGDYRALDLVSERASVVVSGAGRVLVNARATLDVDVSGAAKVEYQGDPKVTQRVSGAARVRRFESADRIVPIA